MKSSWIKVMAYLESKKTDFLANLAIIFLGYAFYNPALRLVPVDFDDLVLLSHVKNIGNPVNFFIQDWGFGNYGYRPLHSLSLWLGYRIFGVSSGPNQLVNIILHIGVVLMLYSLLSRLQNNRLLAFSFSALTQVSLYTFSSPTWISDRPTLFVAIFLLTALNYFTYLNEEDRPNILLLAVLSILALMSKESGLIIPLICLIILTFKYRFSKRSFRAIAVLVIIVTTYGILRFVLFGSSAGTYDESGYLFGFRYYENSASLTGIEIFVAMGENIIKNIIAVFLPLFDGQGKLSLIGTWTNSSILVSTTIFLAAAAFSKKFSFFQKIGLAVIILNALIHFQIFRYRTLYLAQIGLSIFLAASPFFTDTRKSRKLLVTAATAILILWNIHIIGENLSYIVLDRVDTIQQPDFEEMILASSNRIDPDVVSRIISKYRH